MSVTITIVKLLALLLVELAEPAELMARAVAATNATAAPTMIVRILTCPPWKCDLAPKWDA